MQSPTTFKRRSERHWGEAIEVRLLLDANILFSAACRDVSPALLLFE